MKYRFTFLLSLLALLFAGAAVYGQATTASGYYFYPKAGTYSYLSSGTEITTLKRDDGLSGSIPIGFTFRFCGVDYTNVYASCNGWVTFGSLPYSGAYPGETSLLATGSSSGIGPAVMPLWDDVSGDSGIATYTTTGVSPNRVFTIEYRDWLWDYSTTEPAISFQVQLFEGTNIIRFIYKRESGTPDFDYTDGGTIGIGGGSSTDFLSLGSTGTSPTASSTVLTNTLRDKPANGQIYEFSPYPQCAGIPISDVPKGPKTKVCPGADFLLTDNTPVFTIGKTYQWQSRPAGSGAFTDIAAANTASITTNITANTDFRVLVTCTATSSSTVSDTLTVQVLEQPVILASGPVTFCENQRLDLYTASDTSYTYEWISIADGAIAGADDTLFRPETSDRYTLLVRTSSCTTGVASADTIDVTVLPAAAAVINPAPSVTICAGETTTLDGSSSDAGDFQWYNSSGAITAATGSDYTTNVAGAYRLVVTHTGSGCKDTSAATTIVATAPPSVTINPADSTNVCTGLPATLTSVTTGSGLSYQWFNSAGPLSGETGNTLVTPDPETYMLVVTAGSCSDTSTETIVHLWPLPAAVVSSIGSTEAVCPSGSDLVLQASANPGYTYQWFLENSDISGATGRELIVTTPGAYVVKVTDANGCIRYSDTFKAQATPAAFPTVSPSGVVFCAGNHLNLYSNANKYYVSFQWLKDATDIAGATDPTYSVSTSGKYSIRITDSFKCQTTSAPSLVTVMPVPDMPVIALSGSRLYTTNSYAGYQWYRNSVALAGETSRYYTPTHPGYYTVSVYNADDCSSLSDTFAYELTAIPDLGREALSLYPNPSKGKVTISYSAPVDVVIKDLQGRTLQQLSGVNAADLGDAAAGIYFFSISTTDHRPLGTFKIIRSEQP